MSTIYIQSQGMANSIACVAAGPALAFSVAQAGVNELGLAVDDGRASREDGLLVVRLRPVPEGNGEVRPVHKIPRYHMALDLGSSSGTLCYV